MAPGPGRRARPAHRPRHRRIVLYCRDVTSRGRGADPASLGLPVIVEGVSTPGQLALLRDMGHRFVQGYAFSRPLEAEQLAAGAWHTVDAVALGGPAPA